jgi:hypothetical protein
MSQYLNQSYSRLTHKPTTAAATKTKTTTTTTTTTTNFFRLQSCNITTNVYRKHFSEKFFYSSDKRTRRKHLPSVAVYWLLLKQRPVFTDWRAATPSCLMTYLSALCTSQGEAPPLILCWFRWLGWDGTPWPRHARAEHLHVMRAADLRVITCSLLCFGLVLKNIQVFCNPDLFGILTSTFSKLCKTYTKMRRRVFSSTRLWLIDFRTGVTCEDETYKRNLKDYN